MCLLTVYTNTSQASTQVCDLEGKVCDLEGKVCDLEGKVCDQGVFCYSTMANIPVGVQGGSKSISQVPDRLLQRFN